jgi:anthranilate synthase component I
MSHPVPDFETFKNLAQKGNVVPVYRRLLSDQLTPVLTYRRLVRADDRMATSFLLESVEGGEVAGRYSYLAAKPLAEIIARGNEVEYRHHADPAQSKTWTSDDPLGEMDRITSGWKLARPTDVKSAAVLDDLPVFTGGWVGFAGYDTVRYLEGDKLPSPPTDDRDLPDLHFGLYRQVVVFDNAHKTVLVITHALLDEHDSIEDAYAAALDRLDELVTRVETPATPSSREQTDTDCANKNTPTARAELSVGEVDLNSPPPVLPASNMGEGGYQKAVEQAKEYIKAGDIFQVVPSQRFEVKTHADPFQIYRALRVVNPSPYMFYVQIDGGMLIGSSPEILCRVDQGKVVNRPLAGTRRRGRTVAEDTALEEELLSDPKEISEHVMLVDLGRNDVGRVAQPGSIELPAVIEIERYSHVMHISSTVTGQLQPGKTCWDALRMTLPVGTVSGAPKIRAMQIIDELEPTRRGPYGGAVGFVDFAGNMDVAIALRTMVAKPVFSNADADTDANAGADTSESSVNQHPVAWTVHIQAGAGIVADSVPDLEHQECVNKAAAMAKAVDLAEKAFTR